MSQISSSTNMKDRVFVLSEGFVRELRYSNGEWIWINHLALDPYLKGGGTIIGPCLVNKSENVGRLFIRTGEQYVGYHLSQPAYKTRWLIYTFNPTDTDYSSIADYEIGSYSPISYAKIRCSTNLEVSENWKLYGLAKQFVTGVSGYDTVFPIRFDIDLNEIDSPSTRDLIPFYDNDGRSYDSKYVSEGDAKYVRPAVMPSENIFMTTGGNLFQATDDMNMRPHGRQKAFIDTGAGFDNKVFGIRKGGRLYARRYDSAKDKWVWDNHGRPVKKRHFRKYVVGSLRRMNNGVLFLIKPKWGNSDDNFRVYHRWQDDAGQWHWADHGYPQGKTLCEIGPAWDDKFFVRTTSGELYEKHWNANIQEWAWENHGAP